MITVKYLGFLAFLILAAGLSRGVTASQVPRVLVLDFELKDLTPMPATEAELQRTATIGPLLRAALDRQNDIAVIAIDAKAQAEADIGAGYLFDRPHLAAELAARHGASHIAVGRLHKPSFLFAYLQVRLVDVATGSLIGDYTVEIKGGGEKIVHRGVASLTRKLSKTLAR